MSNEWLDCVEFVLFYRLIIDLKILINEKRITFNLNILTIDCAKYVNAAARNTERHCFIFSLGTYFRRIGKARLKLASNSTGKVIR